MPGRTSQRLAFLLLPLVLALAVVFLGSVSVVRKIESFQPLGFEPARAAGGWQVARVDGPSSGLVKGDQLMLVNGIPARSLDELRRELEREPVSQISVLRQGELLELRYLRPELDIDYRYLLLAAAGLIYLLIGLYTVTRRSDRLGLLFFLWCLATAAVYVFTLRERVFDGLDKALHIGEQLARVALPPLTLHLFLLFPRPLPWPWLRRVVPFLYLPAAALGLLWVDVMFLHGRLAFGAVTAPAVERLDRVSVYLLGLFVAAALVALIHRLRSTAEVEHRQQLVWMVLGMTAGYLPFGVFYLLPLALSLPIPELAKTLAVAPLAIVPLTFAYAILRYKLWDIGLIVRNSVASTLTLALAVMGFALANLFVSRGLPERFAATRTMTTFLAGVAIAALAVPTRRGVGAALERIHYRGSFGRRRVLAELGRELLHERDLDALCATLLDHLEMALELPQVNLYLAQKGGSLVAVRPAARLPRELPASLLGEDQWAAEIHAISGFAAPGEDDNPGLELFRAGFRYAFPLTVRGHQVGVLVTGYKLDETPLNSEDIELARQTLNQAAVAIENAQLLDRLHHQLEEVLRLERYTEGIIQSSPAGLAVLDTDGCILSANLAFAAIAGRERRHLLGRPLAEALPIHLPQPGSGLEAQVIEDAAGSEHHLQLSLAQLEGEASGQRILVVQDVSDRVRLENELREKDRLASLGMLAAGVAHEVNTPITGISSYAQLLLDETPEDDPRHGLLKKVERQTFRASQIVRSLLDFARQRRGEQRLVSIGGVLSAAVDELRDRATERGVEVHWQPAGERFLVFGSETELTQVLVNLMTNALDAMKTGGTLTLAVEGDEQRVRASVTDTGSGIPREQIERIFQPFFSTKLSEGGTGLGLSISYEIVRRHGGLMTVASEPGQGSRFCVELPRRHEAQTPPATS